MGTTPSITRQVMGQHGLGAVAVGVEHKRAVLVGVDTRDARPDDLRLRSLRSPQARQNASPYSREGATNARCTCRVGGCSRSAARIAESSQAMMSASLCVG
jgi:hypothetical protein